MSALEKEIIERITGLDEGHQQQVLAYIRSLDTAEFSFDDWLKRVQGLRAAQQASRGSDFRVDIQSLLDEVREEPLDDRLGSR